MAAAVTAGGLPCHQCPARARAPRPPPQVASLPVPPSGNRLVPLHPCSQIPEALVCGHLLIVGGFCQHGWHRFYGNVHLSSEDLI